MLAVLGLLLVLSAVGLTCAVVFQNTASISVDAMGETVSLSSGWLFVAGVATGAVGILGVAMLLGGMARARRRRAALVESRSSVQGLQAERDELAERLERERAERERVERVRVERERAEQTFTTSAPQQNDARTARRSAVTDDGDSAVIDLDDDRSAEAASSRYSGRSDAGREPGLDRAEPVESGRHGLFHRRR